MKLVIGKFKRLTIAILVAMTTFLNINFSFAEDNSLEASLDKNTKTATSLDENLETKINIAFPGKQDVLPTDIVFVLDKSGASAQQNIYNEAKNFLEKIKNEASIRGLNIKVGVVLFNYIGNVKQELTDVVSGYDNIMQALNSSVMFGTNMHAGLLAAKDVLDKDTSVKPENKYVILISDGATYLYCNKDDKGAWNYKTAYTRSFGDPKAQQDTNGKNYTNGGDMKGGIWEYQSREYNLKNDWKQFKNGKNFIFSYAVQSDANNNNCLDEYLNYYRDQEADKQKNWAQYEYKYNLWSAKLGKNRKVTPIDINAPANIDIAFMRADDTFQEMVKTGYNINIYYKNAADFDGSIFLKYLARNSNKGNLNTEFASLEKKVLDKIAKGSSLTDKMGEAFDFVNDIKKIQLKFGNDVLQGTKVEDNKYGFGTKKQDDQGKECYPFELTYTKGDDTIPEQLQLLLNETIYPNKPLYLEYYEKLDLNTVKPGRNKYDTNISAVLSPVDGNGEKGQNMEFAKPAVFYGEDEGTPEPILEIEYVPSSEPEPIMPPKMRVAKTGEMSIALTGTLNLLILAVGALTASKCR